MTEIILIVIIILITIGMGKLPAIASSIGRLRSNFNKGLKHDEPIDITPQAQAANSNPERKPGKFEHSVEDATIDDAK